jgi:hypothetical protein
MKLTYEGDRHRSDPAGCSLLAEWSLTALSGLQRTRTGVPAARD